MNEVTHSLLSTSNREINRGEENGTEPMWAMEIEIIIIALNLNYLS